MRPFHNSICLHYISVASVLQALLPSCSTVAVQPLANRSRQGGSHHQTYLCALLQAVAMVWQRSCSHPAAIEAIYQLLHRWRCRSRRRRCRHCGIACCFSTADRAAVL